MDLSDWKPSLKMQHPFQSLARCSSMPAPQQRALRPLSWTDASQPKLTLERESLPNGGSLPLEGSALGWGQRTTSSGTDWVGLPRWKMRPGFSPAFQVLKGGPSPERKRRRIRVSAESPGWAVGCPPFCPLSCCLPSLAPPLASGRWACLPHSFLVGAEPDSNSEAPSSPTQKRLFLHPETGWPRDKGRIVPDDRQSSLGQAAEGGGAVGGLAKCQHGKPPPPPPSSPSSKAASSAAPLPLYPTAEGVGVGSTANIKHCLFRNPPASQTLPTQHC